MESPSRLIYTDAHCAVGLFRCKPDNPTFENTGPVRGGHMLVFPRTTVRITHEGGSPIVADPNTVMLYNEHQRYVRGKISERGDLCDWFGFGRESVSEAVRVFDPSVDTRPDQPFDLTHAPSSSSLYLTQRMIVHHILSDDYVNDSLIHEALAAILDQAIAAAYGSRPRRGSAEKAETQRAHRQLANEAKAIVAERYDHPLTLEQIAEQLYCSLFHLCRIFRQQCGITLHRYLNQMRLRTALEDLADPYQDLTALALRSGFSSHSHFSQAFRKSFGLSPSQLLGAPSQRLQEMSKNLIA
ncbi:MAG: helix-turn-helix transcriptional regulator [Anaerolineales bacterium]|nr:helix-turn-helix transcriptional regulator [Anaerolineales bacterium]MCB9127659.1 helix-turn-helix transcriptional regulator [Ardenticatenales bacterium]